MIYRRSDENGQEHQVVPLLPLIDLVVLRLGLSPSEADGPPRSTTLSKTKPF